MDFVLVVSGLAILLGAGDALVRGAVALSLRLGIPALIVSLTVVAFGTSAPELLIAVQAALDGAPGIAVGNVVGSNVANVLLVLGLPALICTLDSRNCDSMRSFGQMMFASLAFVGLCFLGPLTWWHGLVLLSLLSVMLFDAVMSARKHRNNCEEQDFLEELEDIDPNMAWWKLGGFLAIGMIGLPAGAHLLIEGARALATDMGVSEAAIGLTLVAVGTSLPELATTLTAALRRQADVAIGNVIGSNLFNLVGIMGVASLITPIAIDPRFLNFDLWAMLAASALLAPFVCRMAGMGRRVGAAFLALYGVYVAIAFVPVF
jgi:cation:H+ antiporter